MSWSSFIEQQQKQPYFKALQLFLDQETLAGKEIYPALENRFNAFSLTPLEEVKGGDFGTRSLSRRRASTRA